MPVHGGPNTVEDGLVLSLDAADRNSYPGSGTTWSDLSGNGNNGVLTNGPTFDSGNQGSIVFDGVDDYSLTPLPTPSNPLSVSIWFKQYTQQNRAHLLGNYYSYLGKGTNMSTYNKRILWYQYSSDFGVGGFGNAGIVGTEYDLNVWNNVVYWNNTAEYRVYLNGILKASTVDSSWDGAPDLSIGANHGYSNDYFNGEIPVVKVYNRALTASEVLQNYNAQKSRFGL